MQISHNGIRKSPQMSAKIRKSQATINPGTSAQIYNLKERAPVLYIVALSELKLNENSEHDEVVMYQNMLHVCVECVTCYVKCVTASSDTAMFAGMSCELNHVLEGCYEKFGTGGLAARSGTEFI